MTRTILNVSKIRELRGVKRQRDISESIGISQNHYSQIENGTRTPSMDITARLAYFFGVGVGELISVNPPPEQPEAGEESESGIATEGVIVIVQITIDNDGAHTKATAELPGVLREEDCRGIAEAIYQELVKKAAVLNG
jgi:transcriptional regulator with XRE-family HTH domain